MGLAFSALVVVMCLMSLMAVKDALEDDHDDWGYE